MKLSKLLISINLAALIPIVAQASSQAAEKATSDKVDWLKENIAAMDNGQQAVKLKSQTACFARRQGSPNASDISMNISTPKQSCELRPFVPNRKLPSEKDLQQSLVAQTPKLAAEPLSGKISSFYSSSDPDYANLAKSPPKTFAGAGLNIKQLSSMAHQAIAAIATAHGAGTEPRKQLSSSGQSTMNSSSPVIDTDEPQSHIPPQLGFPLMRQAERHLNEQSEVTPEASADQSIIDHYAQMELDGTNGDSSTETFATNTGTGDSAGPPPFPLNMLPQASLKQLVRGLASSTRMSAAAKQPYSGSWHGNQYAGRMSAFQKLPRANFHSFIRSASFPHTHNLATRYQLTARPNFYRSHLVAARIHSYLSTQLHPVIRRSSFLSRELLVMQRRMPAPVNIAVYPPYATQPRLF